MKKSSRAFSALLLADMQFVTSRALPAVEIVVLGKPAGWEGWRAAYFAIWSFSDVARAPTLLMLGASGLGNIVFLVAPWLLMRRAPSGRALGRFGVAVAIAFALALWVPHSTMAGSPKLLAGYFAWLLAYAALLGGVVLAACTESRYGGKDETYA